ncbi:hypothetical protein F5Y12DRAFT_762389 [Xylaria sp. FL1777]|nr:hypothetical protein F5Y12DRAFT_762389 [Xylaria sp. FL1777]
MPSPLTRGLARVRTLLKEPDDTTNAQRLGATNHIIVSGRSNGLTETSVDSLWQTAVKRFVSRLPAADQQVVTAIDSNSTLNQQVLEAIFQPVKAAYSDSHFFKCLDLVHPIVNHVKSFAVVIDVLSQACANPACLIWGSIKLLLEISSRSFETFSSICDMVANLSSFLPLFEQWLRLFPTAKFDELSEAIIQTFLEYLSFLVEAIIYLRKSSLVNILRSAISSSFQTKFHETEQAIKKQTEKIILQLHTANMVAGERRHQELHDMLISSTNHSLNNAVHPPIPYHFLQQVARNDRFFGRKAVLANMEVVLTPDASRTRSLAIHGLGGIGKTQVAVEYLYRNIRKYEIIFWLHANSKDNLDDQFTLIARNGGFASTQNNANYCCEAVKHWLQHTKSNWLLVFDGADDLSVIRPFWPAASRGCILITSRSPQAAEEDFAEHGIQLPCFDVADSTSFIISIIRPGAASSDQENEAINELVKIFDGFPMGLKAAASYMRSKRMTPTRFLTLYTQRLVELESSDRSGTSKTLQNIWNMSLDSLSPSATTLLDALVFFDGDAIPTEIFSSQEAQPSAKELEFHNTIESLIQHSLVTISEDYSSICIHKYFQSSMRIRVQGSPDRYQVAISHALEGLCKILPPISKVYMGRQPKNWPAYEKYLSHFRAFMKTIRSALPSTAARLSVELLCRYGSFFYETGQYHFGFDSIQLAIRTANLANDINPRTLAYGYYILAYLNLESNKPDLSEGSLRSALELLPVINKDTTLEAGDTLFVIALNSLLGNSLTGQGKFQDAEAALKLAIDLSLAGGAETSTKLGTLYANLGSCLLWKGDIEGAEAVLHTALLKHQRSLNCNLYALGNVYLHQGRIEEAYKVHVEVLENFSRDFGHTHHATADSCHKVGSILAMEKFGKRDLGESRKYLRKALSIYECSVNQGCLDMGGPIARTRWKLSTILKLIDAPDLEEIKRLEKAAESYAVEHLNSSLPLGKDEQEAFFDRLVLFWSR